MAARQAERERKHGAEARRDRQNQGTNQQRMAQEGLVACL
jgi:hypothetical protein